MDAMKKALLVIETLTSEDLVMDDKERLEAIYKAAHSVQSGICHDTHRDWRKGLDSDYAAFKKMGLI